MKILAVILFGLLLLTHYRLWFGAGSYANAQQLQRQVEAQRAVNAQLSQRNQALAAEVADLKQGLEAIEERARLELGFIKRNEVFYQIVD